MATTARHDLHTRRPVPDQDVEGQPHNRLHARANTTAEPPSDEMRIISPLGSRRRRVRVSRRSAFLVLLVATALILLLSHVGHPVIDAAKSGVGAAADAAAHFVPSANNGRKQASDEDRALAIRVGVLKELFKEKYSGAPKERIKFTTESLTRFGQCLEQGTCNESERTVVLLATNWFGQALGKDNNGEVVWARSTLQAFRALNYTLILTIGHMDTLYVHQHLQEHIPVILWQENEYKHCRERNDANYKELEGLEWGTSGDWQKGKKTCMQQANHLEGIPWWKSFQLAFWPHYQPPNGPRWTLQPEDYDTFEGPYGHTYLGYSLGHRCLNSPIYPNREHRAFILAKELKYLDKDQNKFHGILSEAAKAIQHVKDEDGKDIEFTMYSTAGDSSDHKLIDTPEPGVKSVGRLPQQAWVDALAKSKVLIGLGDPILSPSPYDALCVGVPFICPINDWDHKNPDDRSKWRTQHDAMKHLGPPYVYHVRKNDKAGLIKAIQQAVDNPIGRFIPEQMTMEAVVERHRKFIETDWFAAAKSYVAEKHGNDPKFKYLAIEPSYEPKWAKPKYQ